MGPYLGLLVPGVGLMLIQMQGVKPLPFTEPPLPGQNRDHATWLKGTVRGPTS